MPIRRPKQPGRTELSDLEVAGSTGIVVDESNKRLGIGLAVPKTRLTVEGAVTLKEQAAADTDTAAYGQLWVKTATPNELYFTTDAGNDIQLTSGAATAFVGDITGVTAGVGLSGGGTSGALTLTLDLSELSDVTPANGDKLATLDSDGANEQLTTVAGLATLFAGTGLTASSSVIGVDASQTQITAVGTIATGTWQGTAIANAYVAALPTSKITSGTFADARIAESNVTQHLGAITATGAVNSGSITSGFTSIDVGAGGITTTGTTATGILNATGSAPYVTLKNSTAENGEGGCESRLLFTDHAAATLAQVEGSHSGTADDTKGKLILSTHNGSALTAAVTIDNAQDAAFASHVDIATSHAYKVNGTAILSDSSGTMTLSNVDALDATTEATIEAAIDTLSNLTSIGTIGTGVWQGTAIAQAYIANDAINGDKLADNAVNSEHYTDGSIDTDHIADDQVTLAKMAGLARGGLIIGNASGNPTALSVGSDNHVLTVDSNGDIGWEAAAGGAVDLNGLSAAVVDPAADSIAIIDANDSNASRKESIPHFVSAIAGTGLSESSGVLNLDVGASATGFVSGGVRSTPDQAGEILAMQVFS